MRGHNYGLCLTCGKTHIHPKGNLGAKMVFSIERNKKISLALRGRPFSEAHKQHISLARRGPNYRAVKTVVCPVCRNEFTTKILQQKLCSLACSIKFATSKRTFTMSAKAKESISQKAKLRWANPEFSSRQRVLYKQAWAKPENKAYKVALSKSIWSDPERHKQFVDAIHKRFEDPASKINYRIASLERWKDPTEKQIKLREVLKNKFIALGKSDKNKERARKLIQDRLVRRQAIKEAILNRGILQQPVIIGTTVIKPYTKSAATRQLLSEASKKARNDNPQLNAFYLANFAKARIKRLSSRKPSKPEIVVAKILMDLGVVAKREYQILDGEFIVDFALPDKKIAIQVDGCFWHCCHIHYPTAKYPIQVNNQTHDKEREICLTSLGWQTVHIWEHDLQSNEQIESIKEGIKQCVYS